MEYPNKRTERLVTQAAIDFEWRVDEEGYDIVQAPGAQGSEGQELLLRPKSGRLKVTRPLDFNPALYGLFSALGEDPKACRDFANRFGLLGTRETGPGAPPPLPDEPLRIWLSKIAELRSAVEGWKKQGLAFLESTTGQEIAGPKVFIRRRAGDGAPEMVLRPQSLYDALKVQFAQAILSPTDLYACECCGRWFNRGGGARRRDARFCSDLCRTRFNRGQCDGLAIDPFAGSGSFLIAAVQKALRTRPNRRPLSVSKGKYYLGTNVEDLLRTKIPELDDRHVRKIVETLQQLQSVTPRTRGKKQKR